MLVMYFFMKFSNFFSPDYCSLHSQQQMHRNRKTAISRMSVSGLSRRNSVTIPAKGVCFIHSLLCGRGLCTLLQLFNYSFTFIQLFFCYIIVLIEQKRNFSQFLLIPKRKLLHLFLFLHNLSPSIITMLYEKHQLSIVKITQFNHKRQPCAVNNYLHYHIYFI